MGSVIPGGREAAGHFIKDTATYVTVNFCWWETLLGEKQTEEEGTREFVELFTRCELGLERVIEVEEMSPPSRARIC